MSREKRRVLVFGDSLTWGYAPDFSGRYTSHYRWPEVMESALEGVTAITEALNGRRTAYDDMSSQADLNGVRLLPTLLTSQMPLDLTVIMLGTNDLCCGGSLRDVERGLKRLVEIIRHHPTRTSYIHDRILLVAPPPMVSGIQEEISPQIAELSEGLSMTVRRVAEICNTAFFDAGTVATASQIDGVHFDPETSRALGLAIAPEVAKCLATVSNAPSDR
ncbi:MAG: GDSL-type esterase/lipase family protein [Pseudomonadota bacterium]